jgi:hypothetical protein
MKHLGVEAVARFREKRDKIKEQMKEFRERTGLDQAIDEAIEIIDGEEA